MSSSLLFSINTVLPICMLIFLGWCGTACRVVSRDFMDKLGKICFRYFLSCQIFQDVSTSTGRFSDAAPMISFCLVVTVAVFLLSWLVAAVVVHPAQRRGTFVHVCFRGSFTVLGMSMVRNMYGESGAAYCAGLLTAICIAYNILAVICLSQGNESRKVSFFQTVWQIVVSIAKNPLIIAVALALVVRLLHIELPFIISKPVGYLSSCAVPISLLCVGSGLDFSRLRGSIGSAALGAFIKTLGAALVALPVAVWLGFRGIDLGAMAVLFTAANPSATYVMTASMGGDKELAATAVVVSTVMTLFSSTLVLFILKRFDFL